MKDVVVPVLVALIAGLTGGGMVPLVQAFLGHGRARVDTVEALSDTARGWVAEFKKEAHEARTETHALRDELQQVRREAFALADEVRNLRLAILHPGATLDSLRRLVQSGTNANGTPSNRTS